MARGRLRLTVTLLGLALLPGRAHAVDLLGKYEEALVQDALRAVKLELDPAPEGKRIERIVIHPYDILIRGDFGILSRVPVLSIISSTFLNRLHVRTREYIIRQ